MPDMMDMMPKDLPEGKQNQWKKHYSEAMQQDGMTPEKAASMATEKCMKQNQRSNGMKLSLNGLIGYLQGKGWKVHVNEDAESEDSTFEVVEEPTVDTVDEPSDEMLSAEELKALKGFATMLAKNGQLLSEENLLGALKIVPAAAQLVQNAQEREKLEKDSIIATIKTNSSNVYTDDELAGMSLPVLTKLNSQMNVSYLGMGGAAMYQNAEEPLALPTGLLSIGEEVNNGS